MSFDPQKQFRCTIIRGKAKTDLDNLLPAYARIINDLTPCSHEEFKLNFNNQLNSLLGGVTKKTLDNHRTEIAYKLFGMFTISDDDIVHIGERTEHFLQNSDQPQFFKDICYKFQQPNGIDSTATTLSKIENGISLRPMAFILALLTNAKQNSIILAKNEIAYYVLNSLEVLQGKVEPDMVLAKIIEDRNNETFNKVYTEESQGGSYDMQHINEQLNLMELANLIVIDLHNNVLMNNNEQNAINEFISSLAEDLFFSFEGYAQSDLDTRKKFANDWTIYYSKLSETSSTTFVTTASSLGVVVTPEGQALRAQGVSTKVLGDEGELYVYEYEQKRVSNFNQRLVNKIKWVGPQRGLGYDIQSIFAEHGERAEFAKYIEVKSTKRVTAPKLDDETWQDSIGMTRNEIVAAQQHKESYFIYRVYFTKEEVIVFVIDNPYKKSDENVVFLKPTQYRMEFGANAIDSNF